MIWNNFKNVVIIEIVSCTNTTIKKLTFNCSNICRLLLRSDKYSVVQILESKSACLKSDFFYSSYSDTESQTSLQIPEGIGFDSHLSVNFSNLPELKPLKPSQFETELPTIL